jgi:oligopeptide/dipeptide ABC transporter ATP-binding protein
MNPMLELRDLRVHFPLQGKLFKPSPGSVKAVDGVSLALDAGEVLGLVGESGCGKSTLARALFRLTPITSGEILFQGRDIAALSGHELRLMRRKMQMVFQDPYASLNPRMTVFDAIAEPLRVHRLARRSELAARVGSLMERVGLAPRFMKKYPHEFSGGQRQRIAIARALALDPALLIADEPVSALDVSVQAQILNLLADLIRKEGLSMILISHDLSVVRHLSQRVAVMYLGRIVEYAPVEELFRNPLHPYTRALLNAVPIPDPESEKARIQAHVVGDPPSPINPPSGCPFHPRCPIAAPECGKIVPPYAGASPDHQAACIRIGCHS